MREPVLQTVDRALDLLEILARYREGLRPVDLARLMNLNKVTVHRLLVTLAGHRFIERDSSGSRWQLGLKIIELSSHKLNSLELKTEAQPFLRRLVQQGGQPAHLAILDNKEIVYIEKIETVQSIRMYSQIGKRSPVYCTALGKVLLTGLPDHELSALLDQLELKAYTRNTLIDPKQIMCEIQQARIDGYAADRAEHEDNVFCLAAPVFDYRGQIIAAISSAGQHPEYVDQPDHAMKHYIIDTAEAISRHMGYVTRA